MDNQTGIVVAIFVGLFVAFFIGFLVIRPAVRRYLLSRNGITAKAIVLNITDTGIKIKDAGDTQWQQRPVWEIRLKIDSAGYTRQVTAKHIFAAGHLPIAVGDGVKILIDPKDPDTAILSPTDYTGRSYLL